MNMSVSSDYSDSDSEKEDTSLESPSTSSDSSSECSNVCLENYTSSIESADNDSCNSTRGIVMEDDKQVIFNFYKTLSIEFLQTFSVESWEVNDSAQHLTSNYRNVRGGTLPTDINYTKKSNCIAYLHRYAACHTALVFDAVSDIFNSSYNDVLSPRLSKKSLNVMFLGGGPGNDFVGFLTALHDHHRHLFDLDVTIVDKESGWEDIFNETIENLRQGRGGKAGSFFDEVNVTTTFISTDLKDSEEWDEIMKSKLLNADMVFTVKVLSHIPDDDKPQVLQNIVNSMGIDSLLIYIDYPYPYRAFSDVCNVLKVVYQSSKKRYYLGHKDHAFGCNNITTCKAQTIVFV